MANYTGTITVSDNPPIIPRAFAHGGEKATIPQSDTGLASNRASYIKGFPSITSESLADGGIPPARVDFNGIGYDTSSWLSYFQKGGVIQYDSNVATAIGGYPQNARLWVKTTSGTAIVRAKQINSVNPADEMMAIRNGSSANWDLDLGGIRYWTSGIFRPNMNTETDFNIPFPLTDESNNPNPGIIIFPYARHLWNGYQGYNLWQTLFNCIYWRDDNNIRQGFGEQIFIVNSNKLRFATQTRASLGDAGYGVVWGYVDVKIDIYQLPILSIS